VPRTVFADSPVNVGSIVFDNNNSYLLTGQGSITIQTAAGPALIDVQRGAHRINLPLTIATDTTLQVAPGAALTISDPVTINPDRMLTHSGGGTVVYESTVKLLPGGGIVFGGSAALATLDVGAAAVAVIVSGGDKVLSVSRLNIAPGGALDLKDNDLMVDYDAGHSPIGKIRQHVIDGIHHRAGGILADEGGKVLAIVENTWLARSEWNGVPVDNSTVLGVHTWFGDANLDGEVTTDDYAAIDAALGTAGTARWIDGDFTFEGDVTGIDYAAIDANLGMGTADPLAYVELRTRMIAQHGERFGEGYRTALAAAEAGNFVVVPEPGGFAAVAGAALALLRRRRPAQGLNLIE
jgi:hypothetical protein